MNTSAQPRAIDRLLAECGESHRDPINKLIHWVCVPAIFWCVLALASELPLPLPLRWVPWLDWAVVAAVLGTLYYVRLSSPLAVGMAVVCLTCLALNGIVRSAIPFPLWKVAIAVFAVAGVLQFIGHAIEGRRPSFFKDVQFLLIGPAWLMSFVFTRLGIGY